MPNAVIRVEVNEQEIRRIGRSPGIKQALRDAATPIQRRAQLDAPKSQTGSHGRPPGYLASQIKIREGESLEGPYVRVTTEARTPEGFRYGAYWQRRRPYLRAGTNLSKG